MGLLNMGMGPMKAAAMPKPKMPSMAKPMVDMPGKRAPIRHRPKKVKVKPAIDARAMKRVKLAI